MRWKYYTYGICYNQYVFITSHAQGLVTAFHRHRRQIQHPLPSQLNNHKLKFKNLLCRTQHLLLYYFH